MSRFNRRGRVALGSFVIVLLTVLVGGGQARATATPTIASITTYGASGYMYSSTGWAVHVPSSHSNDSTVPVDFEANPSDAKMALNSGAFFTSGQAQNLAPNSGWALHVCPSSATTSTDVGCVQYGFSVYKTTTTDDGLISLTTSPVAISYSASTTDYSIRVAGSTDHLDVSAQPDDTQASMTIAGTPGTSQSVPLQPIGTVTDIPVVVTSADGNSHATYTIHVSRGNADATLSSLAISPGSLTPAFSSDTLSYTTTVPSSTTTVAVTHTNSQNGSSVVSVDGNAVADESAIPLDATNPTHIVITSNAEDPTSTPAIDYTIDVTRLASEGLTIAKAGSGSGTVTGTSPDTTIDCGSTCSANYDEGTSVTLHEAPASGSIFAGWSGDCSGGGTDTTFTMPSSAATCTATFETLGAAQTKSPFTVNLANDEDDGGCYANRCTLRAALAAAEAAGGTIKFTVETVALPGGITYAPNKTLTIDGGTNGVTITGGGLEFGGGTITLKNLTIDGASETGLSFGGGSATLTDVSSTNHSFPGEGGGIFFEGSKLTMTGGSLSGNQPGACGGIEAASGAVTLTDVGLFGNTAEYGGAICVDPGATVTTTGAQFIGNDAQYGGAIFDGGTLVVSDSVFWENTGETAGAAIDVERVSSDAAPGTATIANSTFAQNPFFWTIEDDSGGAVTIVNSTIAENGGGIGGANIGNISLLNTLVSGNPDGGDCDAGEVAPVTSLGHNVDGDGSCFGPDAAGQPTDKSNTGDPRLGDPTENGTFPLENGSPALDAGTKTAVGGVTVPAKDALGTARPQGGAVDVGAMEMPEHKLTIKTVGSGTVGTDEPATPATGLTAPSGWFVAGSTVHLTATPDGGGPAFGKWTGGCTGTGNETDVAINADTTCTATFVDPPTITSFAPSHGRIRSLVTIHGTHLDGITSAAFGAVPATIKSATATSAVLVVPDGVGTSAVTIHVTNAASTADSATQFTPDWPAPTITSISPKSAKAGATVTITGHDFLGVTGVTFTGSGDTTGAIVGTPTDTKVQVTVPDTATDGELTLTTPGGSVDSPAFTFLAPATISSFTADARFGETVTITGTNLASTTSVEIAGVTVKPSTKPSDTQVTVVVPTTAEAGSAPLVVTNSGGDTASSTNFTLDWWTPTVTGVTPASARPGQKITVTGTHFTRASALDFGVAAEADTIKVANDTTITATVPLNVGAAPVQLTVVAGDGSTTSSDDIVFTPSWPQPKVTSFTPAAAKAGATVTIHGSDFLGVTNVAFNGHSATITGTPTDTKLTVLVPDNTDASGPIAVTTQGATPTGQSTGQFLFLPKPANLTLDKTTAAVGEQVTISGDNLGTTSAVTFNGHKAKFKIAADKASVTATVPDADDDGGTITVTNAGGSADVPNSFTQGYNAPTIASFTPGSGLVGSTVTITGTGFRGTEAVTFNGLPSGGYLALSDTKLTVTVPFGAALSKGPIRVTTPGGHVDSGKDFTPKWPKPTIKSFTPGSATAGDTVTVTGTNFVDVTAVKVGGVDCAFTVDSKTQITLTVPDGATTGKITITNNDGTATSGKALTIT